MKWFPSVCCAGFALTAVCGEVSGPIQEAEFSPTTKMQKHPALRGVDFWNLDAMHVPASPVRNLLPNPSFRQGMRYYFRMWGGNFYREPKKCYRYEIVKEGRRPGAKSLLIHTGEQTLPGSEKIPDMMSFPMPLEPGKNYVLSCYAKSDLPEGAVLTLCMTDTMKNFSYRTPYEKKSLFPLTDQWQRCVYRFRIHKKGPESVNLNGNNRPPSGKIWITDIQLEEGDAPTEFTAPEKEGLLITSSPDNTIDADKKIDAEFELFGNGGGTLELKLYDYWRKKVWSGTFPMNPARTFSLPFDALKLGKGSFCLQAKYIRSDGKIWYDYYRFSVLEPILNRKSATRNFFGTSFEHRAYNRNEMYRQYARAGFGNDTYGCYDSMQKPYFDQYGFRNQTVMLIGAHINRIRTSDPEFRRDLHWLANLFKLDRITPADEERIEKTAYRIARAMPQEKRWSFANEAECHTPILKEKRYEEWGRAAVAAYRGLKRANPEIEFFVETGTSCYMPDRGYEVTEEHIKTGERHGIKWEYIGIHPYSVLDGGRWSSKKYTLDGTIAHLFDVLKKYNYPETTPVYVTESFNLIHQYVPEWKCGGGADQYPVAVKASYDFSREEVSQAAWAARNYLLCLKFWPRLKMVHIWRSAIWHDITLNMIPLANAVNTLRVLFPDPEFVTDFRPAAGVHAYLFRGKDGRTTAALWTSREEAELHQIPGVRFRFRLNAENAKLADLMGNGHELKRDAGGYVTLMLNAAPLFLSVDHADEKALIDALKTADTSISATSCLVSLIVKPDGSVAANAKNQERLACDFKYGKTTVSIGRFSETAVPLIRRKPEFGKLFRGGFRYRYQYPGLPEIQKSLNMIWFFVPHTDGPPDWSKIPALEVPHRVWGWRAPATDFSAKCQLAWDERNLYLRITAKDDCFIPSEKYAELVKNGAVWQLDNGLEFYLDYDGKGKSSANSHYEMNYYRYDFAYGNPEGKPGPGFVYRRQEPDMQLTGGTDTPSKEEAAKKIPCDFRRTADGYIYTITFPFRYIAPMKLTAGTHAGFAVSLIDIDAKDGKPREKRLCFTESGAPNERMSAWASIVLMK